MSQGCCGESVIHKECCTHCLTDIKAHHPSVLPASWQGCVACLVYTLALVARSWALLCLIAIASLGYVTYFLILSLYFLLFCFLIFKILIVLLVINYCRFWSWRKNIKFFILLKSECKGILQKHVCVAGELWTSPFFLSHWYV